MIAAKLWKPKLNVEVEKQTFDANKNSGRIGFTAEVGSEVNVNKQNRKAGSIVRFAKKKKVNKQNS